jgi:hypothetical protein
MRLQLVNDDAVQLADLDGDGIDDETGEPVEEPVPADEEDTDEPTDDEPAEAMSGHRWVLAIEGSPTGDGRSFLPGALSWRDLPLPFMATDVTGSGHDGAKLVANIVQIDREGETLYGITQHIASDDADVLRLQGLIDSGDLRGVSVDLDQVEGSVIFEDPSDDDMEGSMPLGGERLEFSAARIMGATATPFPAFAEAQRADLADALVAGATMIETAQPEASPISTPVIPPLAWFDNPSLDRPTPMTVSDDGQMFGHLALFDSCHIGFSDRCVRPPRSNSNYQAFHTGELVTAEGSRVRVGNITVDCGHADLRASAQKAAAHYDDTGWVGADVCCGEDQFGIWVAGALRPGLDPVQVRAVMAADVSGDWRSINGNLELVGIASVNVPGFTKAQFAAGDRVALVASVPVCQETDPGYFAIAERIASSVGLARWQADAERDRLALSVGVHPSQRRRALAERVNG